MQIEAIIGLMRMAEDGNKVVANLAKTVLSLVEGSRELQLRADLAEAALEAERAKVAQLQAVMGQLKISGQVSPDAGFNGAIA